MIHEVLSLILGGGKGTRLFPLTQSRSKPAVPFGGKFRLIDVPISNCINSGIKKIFVLTQYNSESLNRHLNMTYQFDSFSKGFVALLAAEQTYDNSDWFQGTADAVRKSFKHIQRFKPKHVLILSGDQLYQMDFSKLYKEHTQMDADITICTIPVKTEETPEFGIMTLDPNKNITHFREKPPLDQLNGLNSFPLTDEKPYLASMGIYLFKYEILEKILFQNDQIDFGKEIIPSSIGNFNVKGFVYDGYWSDIGTIKNFYLENLAMTNLNPEFSLYDRYRPLFTNKRDLAPAKLVNAQVTNSIFCEGTVIRNAMIDHCIVGIRSVIDENTIIKDSIILGSDYYRGREQHFFKTEIKDYCPWIGNNCVIKNCIVDKNAIIEANVKITNEKNIEDYDGDNYYIRDSIVIIPKNSVVKSGTVI